MLSPISDAVVFATVFPLQDDELLSKAQRDKFAASIKRGQVDAKGRPIPQRDVEPLSPLPKPKKAGPTHSKVGQ